MKRVALTLASGLMSLALAGAAIAAPAATHYEILVMPGTPATSAGAFRINTGTGQVEQAWGSTFQFAAMPDSPTLPAGDYHLQGPTWVDPTGKVSWCLYRIDQTSGRVWVATGGGTAPLVWNEITASK